MIPSRLRALLGAALSLLLTACASPVYKVVYDYIPPTAADGPNCVMQCQTAQQSCQLPCDDGYRLCMERSPEEARLSHQIDKDRYLRELERYNGELEAYYSSLARYEDRRRELERDRDRYERDCRGDVKDKRACKRLDEVKDELRWLSEPGRPGKPVEPSYSASLQEQQGMCSRDCGCEVQYNGCYTACGGAVRSRQVCVENCD
jgi:hypothetical protein